MLSVIIITKNEGDRIKACLESVEWADEIIIADNGSQDKTLELAKEYTDKIIVNQKADFAQLRNTAIKAAKGDWVLYIDADERIIMPLREEIQKIVNDDNIPYSAYAISRRNVVFGCEQKYGPFWPDWVIRLIRKSDFISWVGSIHEYATFNGTLGYTKNSLLHLTHRDIDQIVMKSLDFSKIDALLRLKSHHPKMTGWRFIRILISELFYQGIIRKGFFSGSIGTMDSILQTFSMCITYVRLWQLQQPKPLNEVYDGIDEQLVKNNFKY